MLPRERFLKAERRLNTTEPRPSQRKPLWNLLALASENRAVEVKESLTSVQMNPDMSGFLGAEQFLGPAKVKAALTITVLGSSPNAHWSVHCAVRCGVLHACAILAGSFLGK